jgi:hypothetical protein
MCRSAVMTGSIHCLTGGLRVSFLGLSKRFTAIIKGLIRVIGGFGA